MKVSYLTVCVFALSLVAAAGQQSAPKSQLRYPNELPNLKLYQNAKWNTLKPYVSTTEEVEKLLGQPVPASDDRLRGAFAFEYDPDWIIEMNVVGEDRNLLEAVAGRVLLIRLYPRKRVSVVGADFSAFHGYTYTDSRDRNVGGTVYYDKFGLRYSVYAKDSDDGRFHAGDLEQIIYGPSDEETRVFERARRAAEQRFGLRSLRSLTRGYYHMSPLRGSSRTSALTLC